MIFLEMIYQKKNKKFMSGIIKNKFNHLLNNWIIDFPNIFKFKNSLKKIYYFY